MPMVPPAPGRFSTTSGWPSAAASLSATGRAMVSVADPGVKGTMMRIGLAGKGCADAAQAAKRARLAARLGVEVGAQCRLRIGRRAELAQRVRDQAAEGGERDARGLELPRRDGDDVAAQLERIADGEAARVGVLEREEQ